MNIIVLDLEWNQTPYGRGSGKKEMPFEIIELGAVKLDASGNELARFSEKIRPQVYKKLHPIMTELLHVTEEELRNADIFQNVWGRFSEWCGMEYRFATWGSMDLTELQRNCRYFHVQTGFEKPLYFYDIQKVYSILNDTNAKTLEAVVDELQIEKDESFHEALSDAVYTSRILKKLPMEKIEQYVSVDYFQNPKSRKEEIKLKYPGSSLFVSREYDTKEEVMKDKKVRSLPCVCCGRKINKKIHWFSDNSNHFYCLGFCAEDGYLLGKINLKKTIEGKVFGVKNIYLVEEERALALKEKQQGLREKRREKKLLKA